MAALYVEEIQRIQPQGPYFLGGYSFGGIVALEMAHQLFAQGQEVAILALLDTFPGRPETNRELLGKFLRMSWSEKVSYLSWRGGYFAKFLGRRAGGQVLPPELLAVRQACLLAESRYVPKIYPGRVTVFRPAARSLRGGDDATAGWAKWASGGVDVHDIPGNHGTFFFQPNVQTLAEGLRRCLDVAESALAMATKP